MKLTFTKMHGAGNDFIVIDGIHQQVALTPARCRQLADRRFGIGADQILLVEAPTQPDTDFRYRIFNADGGEVEQCGNGARAFVRFVTDKGLCTQRTIRVATLSGIIAPTLREDGTVSVDMGTPHFAPTQIPFDPQGLAPTPQADDALWPLEVFGKTCWLSLVSMGNPHAVQVVPSIESAEVATIGPAIEHHPQFPRRVNVGFMQIDSRQQIQLRVHERGAGETLACGTGACAAVVAGIRRGELDSPVRVRARGGELVVAWDGGNAPVYLSGPAVTVFEGEIDL
ncbi:MAG: diaminopimelate epimerase [Pseudomonadota bacterium]|nr:diaminopimelate epimerase [Pseudomonadota bacterium]